MNEPFNPDARMSRRQVLVASAGLAVAASLPAVTRGNNPSNPSSGAMTMSTITTKDGTQIYFKDWGAKEAQPIVFHHGWPLSADDWDNQMLFFLGKGYRVVAHDRRGHGRSTQVSD